MQLHVFDPDFAAVAERLVSGITHDLSRPLRVLEQRAARIAANPADPAHVLREAGKIEEVTKQLLASLRELGSEYHAGSERDVAVPLDDVVKQASFMFDDPGRSPRIQLLLAPGLPSVTKPGRIRRVIGNLIANALAACDPDGVVQVRAARRGTAVRIEVIDRGSGMPPEVASRAFDLFFTTQASRGGTGVGLATTREIVESLGGRIQLDTRVSEGTRAIVDLPITREIGGGPDPMHVS